MISLEQIEIWRMKRKEGEMSEANRILGNCARVPQYHGSVTADEVDEIMGICGGEVFCNGHLREFVFKKITPKTFTFKTIPWKG